MFFFGAGSPGPWWGDRSKQEDAVHAGAPSPIDRELLASGEWREQFGARAIHIPYSMGSQGATDRVSQPLNNRLIGTRELFFYHLAMALHMVWI